MISRRRRGASEVPELNLTPLIDVVFLLLIFFMVSTTFEKQSEIELELPEASRSESPEPPPNVINVQLDVDGRLFIDERPLADASQATLRSALRAAVARLKARASLQAEVAPAEAEGVGGGPSSLASEPVVVLSADAAAPVQSLVTVLDVARQLGLTNITFPTRFDEDQ